MTAEHREFAESPGILERTLHHLEWARLRSAVLARCTGPSARRKGLRFAASAAQTREILSQTREAGALLARGEPLPLSDLRDIEGHLDRIERQGTVDAQALADVRITLQHAKALRRFLGQRKSLTPALSAIATFDPSLDELETQLGSAVELDGTLRSDASDALRKIRDEIDDLRERIVGRLRDLIERQGDLLSDAYYTLREGRYVLPVRRDAHDRVVGIVHGASASGSSIFVEPRAVVAHGNRLKMAEAEREREELRILSELSARLREHVPSLRAAGQALDLLDLRHASALLGRDLGGLVPELADEPIAKLVLARHPLLVLDGVPVVANDIELEAGKGLVISGPNAGGKTVVLKTVGLFALMLRAGLPLPVAEGSVMGVFESVLSELGDEQSTATNLSTFSAHVKNLATLLAQADARSLVLLDEVATGTDPGEGSALACALTEAFCERGAALVVTTHYEALKALSLRHPRLRSASVGFDAERMQPTFRLLLDVPGSSSALAVARRFGLPSDVLDAAERLIPQHARDFEQLTSELTKSALALQAEREALAAQKHALERERHEYETRLAQLREQSRQKLSKEAERLFAELRQARSELEQARSALRKDERRSEDLSRVQKQLSEAAARVAIGSEVAQALEKPPLASEAQAQTELVQGMRVYVTRLRSQAVIAETQPHKRKALVAVGAMKLWVDFSDVRALPAAGSPEPVTGRKSQPEPNSPAVRTSSNTLDVRGLRADDALAMLESFIDRLYAGPERVGYVVHGHGTGALRAAVRDHLQSAGTHIEHVAAAAADEGGDAVTVFHLK